MEKHRRIHVFGASGCGATTLGKALGERLHLRHLDSDDFFWTETAVPYTVKREHEERAALLEAELRKSPGWVLSGSLCEWGNFAIPLFTLAVFLWIPPDIRLARLKERELRRFGSKALSPGGWFHENHLAFMEYASLYDTAGPEVRSRVLHEAWMKNLSCAILRFEEPLDMETLVERIEKHLDSEAV